MRRDVFVSPSGQPQTSGRCTSVYHFSGYGTGLGEHNGSTDHSHSETGPKE
jgi:hypothetical protein